MRRSLLWGLGLLFWTAAASSEAQVSCAGLPAFASCTAYASGTAVTFNGHKYTAIASISATRDCPPTSPYDPGSDNWWTDNGACSSTGTATSTATATATKTATATATRTPTATATVTGSTATATRTSTATATTPRATATFTATRTSTATATVTSGTGCAAAWSASTAYNGGAQVSRTCGTSTQNYQAAYWTQGNDPCTSSGAAGSGQPWIPKGVCGGSTTSTATATATRTPTSGTATATRTPTATATATTPTATPTSCGTSCPAGNTVMGYFAQWGIYDTTNPYFPKNIETSGAVTRIDVINYAFNNVRNNKCSLGITQAGVGDAYADYGMGYDATQSIDGVADAWEQPLKGNFNQLKKLKARHPGVKVVMSLGGWTWSDGFYSAANATNRAAFVASCIDAYVKGNLPKDTSDNAGGAGIATGIFDGIDLDWEYPGVCGNTPNCAASSADKANLTGLIQEFRKQLDAAQPGLLLTAAVSAGSDKIVNYDIAGISGPLDRINLMSYDFFGAWDAQGPTAFHSPLFAWTGMPASGQAAGYWSDHAVQQWKSGGAPASKLFLGIGYYGRGWTGVPNTNSGLNQAATGPAPAPDEPGNLNYNVLATRNSPSFVSSEAQTQWTYNGTEFWSFDTPATIATKMSYVRNQGMGGAFFWSFDGDTASGTLTAAIRNGLP